jgi:hypothetical protein
MWINNKQGSSHPKLVVKRTMLLPELALLLLVLSGNGISSDCLRIQPSAEQDL